MSETKNGENPGDRDALGKFTKGNSYAAKPGEVRNPTGRPKVKPFQTALKKAFEEDKDRINEVIDALITAAESGNITAIKEIREIFDGGTEIEITGKDGEPIKHEFDISDNAIKGFEEAILKQSLSDSTE